MNYAVTWDSGSNLSYLQEIWASRAGQDYQHLVRSGNPVTLEELSALREKVVHASQTVPSSFWNEVLHEITQEELRATPRYSGVFWRQMLRGRVMNIQG